MRRRLRLIKIKRILKILFVSSALCASSLHAASVVILWHSLAGSLGGEFVNLIQRFNHSQSDIIIKPQYKGGYIETLTSFAAAKRASKPPDMVQVFEVGSAYMMQAPGLIDPVGSLMKRQGRVDFAQRLLPGIASFYSRDGELQAMPFNASIPVMFYNAGVLKRLGYDASSFPKTWQSFEILLQKLRSDGHRCGYATAYPAWIHVEAFASLHGLDLTNAVPYNYEVNQSLAISFHWQRLKRWQNQGLFVYGGRNSDATILFTSGRCPLFSQSSGSLESIRSLVDFPVGVARLPFDERWASKAQSPLFGGAALWVMAGLSKQKQQGIANFFNYASQASVQKSWYKSTGYLPISGWGLFAQKELKGNDLDVLSIAWEAFKTPGESANNIPQNQLRTILDQSMESVFSNQLTVTEALSLAQKRINYRLHRYKAFTS